MSPVDTFSIPEQDALETKLRLKSLQRHMGLNKSQVILKGINLLYDTIKPIPITIVELEDKAETEKDSKDHPVIAATIAAAKSMLAVTHAEKLEYEKRYNSRRKHGYFYSLDHHEYSHDRRADRIHEKHGWDAMVMEYRHMAENDKCIDCMDQYKYFIICKRNGMKRQQKKQRQLQIQQRQKEELKKEIEKAQEQ
jgi:hypothetical protein